MTEPTRLPRFPLRSLVLAVLLAGSGYGQTARAYKGRYL
jgi:hypothetical protein